MNEIQEYFKGNFGQLWDEAIFETKMEGDLSYDFDMLDIRLDVQMEFPEEIDNFICHPGVCHDLRPMKDGKEIGYLYDFYFDQNFGKEKSLSDIFADRLYELYVQSGYLDMDSEKVHEIVKPFADFLKTKNIKLSVCGVVFEELLDAETVELGENWDT